MYLSSLLSSFLPSRTHLLTHPRQVLSEQMATSLTSVLDRINSQWFRISQRLQWAAGSNPQLNATIDEFERAMNRRKIILQVRKTLTRSMLNVLLQMSES